MILVILFLSCNSNSNSLIKVKFKDTVSKELNDSIIANFLKGVIKEKPVVYINGEKLIYPQNTDTVILPFNSDNLGTYLFLKDSVSMKIYGEEGKSGAIVIIKNE